MNALKFDRGLDIITADSAVKISYLRHIYDHVSQLRDFARHDGKNSHRLVYRGILVQWEISNFIWSAVQKAIKMS